MDSERDSHSGPGVPLPGFGEAAPHDRDRTDQGQTDRTATTRADGIRHVRRMSNWTAAALIVGTGAATVALAHQAFPASAPAANTAVTAGTGAAATSGASGPAVTHSVATTSGSGVTVTTTTRTVNGKAIVTHVRHAPAYHDN